ncbi:hypothetical protein [Chryseobacterium sp. M5A1_1a]
MNNPVYNFEIKAFYCLIELKINDILVFCHYEENGSIWIDWPLNQYILESGIQSFEVKVLPYKNHKTLSEKAQLEIGIHAINTSASDRIEIIEKNEVNIPDKEKLPFYVHKGTFTAAIPYKNTGWKDSVDLKKEDEKKLLSEILQWNSKLLNIYTSSDIKEYNAIYREREKEFAVAYYTEYQENTPDIFHSKFKNLTALPNTLYPIVFYAGGKLASVKLPKELPGFTYDPKVKDEDGMGISLILLFHRKKEGGPLEIIR